MNGITTHCLVLNENDFIELILNNKEYFKEELEDWGIENDNDFDTEILDLLISRVNRGNTLYQFSGCVYINNEKYRHFDNDTIFIVELAKNNLWNKYENEEEIITELTETLEQEYLYCDSDFIKEHFGFLEGTY